MARPASSNLTEHELMIMRILWEEEPLTVNEILKRFPREPKPAYTSLLTALQAMTKKGVLAHKPDGKAYRYSPLLKANKYKRSALKRLVSSVFGGNAYDLAVNLIQEENLSKEDLHKLKNLLEDL